MLEFTCLKSEASDGLIDSLRLLDIFGTRDFNVYIYEVMSI